MSLTVESDGRLHPYPLRRKIGLAITRAPYGNDAGSV